MLWQSELEYCNGKSKINSSVDVGHCNDLCRFLKHATGQNEVSLLDPNNALRCSSGHHFANRKHHVLIRILRKEEKINTS
ncbi:MAG: hypothetical protein WCS73_05745 [Lentisphaeria bacterium]